MLSNLHTHSCFCDGKNTLEEIVSAAIERGFSSIGFSGHGYTPFDLSYCMKDTDGYIREIARLREKYRGAIEIVLGIEEDAFSPVDRARFDYILGSSHYVFVNGRYLPIDSNHEGFLHCLDAFHGDVISFAKQYYTAFCAYIEERHPDIIGHFDLLTKYEEEGEPLFLCNAEYNRMAEGFIERAARCGCIFEVNTGALARGLRSRPYPAENLLRVLKRCGAPVILSSDCHQKDKLDFAFPETERYLKDIGFRHTVIFKDGRFIKKAL